VVIDAAEADSCARTLRALGESVFAIGVIGNKGSGANVTVA
jgi:phosphoribosylformylglycinamidine cyclo-ligase